VHKVDCVAIVLDLPEDVVLQRHAARADRSFAADVIARQRRELAASLDGLAGEGIHRTHTLRDVREVEAAQVIKVRTASGNGLSTGAADASSHALGAVPV
jgi:predicted kinase